VYVVETPVVDVVDDGIVGDGLERLTRVLGNKPEHAPPVFGGGMGFARKVFGIHAEEAGYKDLFVLAINTAVPLTGQELPSGRVQRLTDGLGRVRLWAHGWTAIRGTIEGEVDARLAEPPAQNAVFDVIKAQEHAPGTVPGPDKELAVVDLPDRADRIFLHHRREHKGIIGIDPVGQGVLGGGEALWRRVGAGGTELRHKIAQ
jgi:hypothetical protein